MAFIKWDPLKDPRFNLVCKVPRGSAMLYNHNNGFAVDLHERESGSTTIIQKNVVNYSCAE